MNIRWGRANASAAVSIWQVLVSPAALLAIPPYGGEPATAQSPPGRVQPRGESRVDWESIAEGVLRGLQQPPSRGGDEWRRGDDGGGATPFFPRPPDREPRYRPPIRPVIPERTYPQPVYPQPVYPRPTYPEPTYVEPVVPQPTIQPPAVQIQPTAPIPSNVVSKPPVIRKVPSQPSPFSGRVWEASVRETRCYATELRNMSLAEMASLRSAMGKSGGPGTGLYDQLEEIRTMLEQGASWRELRPLMQQVLDQHRSAFSGRLAEQWQSIMRIVLVHDAFLVASTAAPRGRGSALALSAIPTGMIWILYDPTLPPGVALLVSERVLVCGGGAGTELRVVNSSAAEALGLPVAPGNPEPDISSEEARSLASSIVISHRKDAATPVNYLLNSQYTYSIKPGHKQKLDADQEWIIEFDRGGGRGAARYSLTKGTYEFRIVSDRWELVRVKYRVNIDNTAGKQDFRYLMNNEVVTVKAGETQEYQTDEPIVLEFDRGEGAEKPARKNLNKNGTYKVAIDTDTNYLDLFATDTA